MTTRRLFLRGCAAAAGGLALGMPTLFARRAKAESFGPLVPDPAGVLDLPAGFSYTVLQSAGETMSDGYRVPERPDAMACFPGASGEWILMRNHENSSSGGPYGSASMAPPEAYDADSMGGVTRVVLNPETLALESSNLVLTGTRRNCAGGMSPWGWLTCEENVDDGHGYVFVCDPAASAVQMPRRVPGYGRFNHEAAVVDPATNVAYLTEDRDPSAFYRFVPDDPGDPFVGRLQALRAVSADRFDTGDMAVGETIDVDWVDIEDPDPATDTVRFEAFLSRGALEIHRGEGLWFADGVVYICSTNGGPVGGGQIFALRDTPGGATLELIAMSTDRSVLDMPDNITVAPWGDLYLAEDGSGSQYLRILEPSGAIADFARNAVSGSEFAGVCFSPDGSTLFVNIQGDGLTLAVTGPFPAPPPGGADAGVSDPTDAGIVAADGGALVDGSTPGIDGGVIGRDAGPAAATGDGCGCSVPGASEGSGAGGAIAAAAVAATVALRRREDD